MGRAKERSCISGRSQRRASLHNLTQTGQGRNDISNLSWRALQPCSKTSGASHGYLNFIAPSWSEYGGLPRGFGTGGGDSVVNGCHKRRWQPAQFDT